MNETEARRFAEEWIAAWNRRDVDAVVAHFADDCAFFSPRAAAVAGQNPVEGREALRRYWHAAVAGIGRLEFTLRDALYDSSRRALAIQYTARIDDARLQAVELYRFRADGAVEYGEALYGSRVE